MTGIDWYREFVDLSYSPGKDDLRVLYSFEPSEGIDHLEAAGRIASESSTGTWTTLSFIPERMRRLQATAFRIEGGTVEVAYPLDLWEKGNICQLLSGIAGNIFGMKGVRKLRLIDAMLPTGYVRSFKGPNMSIEGIRRMMGVKGRPLTGAVPKPKIGFSAVEHARIGFETWMGGFDFVKDDENLSSLSFNTFDRRVVQLAKMRDRAESRTGDTKDAFVNITAKVSEMKKRADLLHDSGFRYAMMDVVIVGHSAVQELRDHLTDLGMAIHAHRAMHAAFTRDREHGISMPFLAKTMRLSGVNQIHSGTTVGKLVGAKAEVTAVADVLRERLTPAREGLLLEQDWDRIKTAFPVSSGGLHPGLVPEVMSIYGNDMVLLVSGGIHGHPKGTRAGAAATVQAIEAFNDGVSLGEKAERSKELREALDRWGAYRPV